MEKRKIALVLIMILVFGIGISLGIWAKNRQKIGAEVPAGEEGLISEEVPSPINVNSWVVGMGGEETE